MITTEEKIASQKLLEIMRKYQDKEFLFVEPGGNFGDHLIYKGAYKLAKLAGIQFQIASHEAFMNLDCPSETVIYLHGGGGFVPWWSGKPEKALQKSLRTHKGIMIVGPTTFSDDEVYLKKVIQGCFQENITQTVFIFVRDETSYEILKKLLPAEVILLLDHDTALNLRKEDLTLKTPSQKFTFFAIREDKEANARQAAHYLSFWFDPVFLANDFDEWVTIHLKANRIVTNRTHSAILGSILEKPTTILPNSYHKNHSVWKFSLSKRGVEWKETLPGSALSKTIHSISSVRKICSSRLYKLVLKKLLMSL